MKLVSRLLFSALLPCVLSACRSQAAPARVAPPNPEASGSTRVPVHFTAKSMAPDLQARLTRALKTLAPDAKVRRDGDQVIVEYHAHGSRIHPRDMAGRRALQSEPAFVPGADGFIVTVSLVEGDFVSQAVLGYENHTDFGITRVDAYVLQPGVLTAVVRLDRGKECRPALTARIKGEIENWVRARTGRATLQQPPG